jgi:flagellar motor switch protein FliM
MAYEQVLSQDEVDALLQGVTGGESTRRSHPRRRRTACRPTTWARPTAWCATACTRWRSSTSALRALRSALLNFMRRSPDISVGPVQIQQYGEFVRHLPVPANINMIHMKPLRGTALFVFDPKLVFLVVDNLFGSDGRYHVRVEGRDFTRTEQRIIKRLLDLSLQCYGDAWQPVFPLDFDYVRAEMHGKLANIVAPNEVVINTTLQIEFGPVGGFLHVCIPYSMIEPIKRPAVQPDPGRGRGRQALGQADVAPDAGADVELVADFVTMPSTLGEVLKLQVGDVLPIELPTTVVAKVDGMPVMECGYGTANERYALRVQNMITHQDTDPKNDHD